MNINFLHEDATYAKKIEEERLKQRKVVICLASVKVSRWVRLGENVTAQKIRSSRIQSSFFRSSCLKKNAK